MSEEVGFSAADYAVFISMLVLSTAIGLYWAIKDRKAKNVDNYQFGDKKISPIAVGLSISMTYVSAANLLGQPANVYIFGTVAAWYTLGSIIPFMLACLYFIPLYHKLQLQTIYQYLELRFNSKVRKFMSFYVVVQGTVLTGLNLYLLPLSLAAVTPLSFNESILITSAIVIFYTTLGGYKAVVWADTLQSIIVIAGTIAIFIRTVIVVGGFGEMWDAVERGGRYTHMEFSLDPTLQRTFWTAFVGQTFTRVGTYCYTQATVQRYVSCKSMKDARIALLVGVLIINGYFLICVFIGCAAYKYFENCDPLLNGEIEKYDQMIPLLVTQIFRDAPGMTGLFVAAVYSGTLSTVSSAINTLGLMTLQDLVAPSFPRLTQKARITISKIASLIIGFLMGVMGFLFQFIDSNIITLSVTLVGSTTGPTFGLFTLAIFVPWANAIGAAGGTFIALAFNLWISICSFVYGIPPEKVRALSGSVKNCTGVIDSFTSSFVENTSSSSSSTLVQMSSTETTTPYLEEKPYFYYNLYAMSFEYYVVLGFIVSFVTGILISFITKPNSPSDLDPKLFVPIMDNKYLPAKVRKFFRFGVREEQIDENEEVDKGREKSFDNKSSSENNHSCLSDDQSHTFSTKL